jgi:hypothetical protein
MPIDMLSKWHYIALASSAHRAVLAIEKQREILNTGKRKLVTLKDGESLQSEKIAKFDHRHSSLSKGIIPSQLAACNCW